MNASPSLVSLFKEWLHSIPDDQQLKAMSRWMKPNRWRSIGASDHYLWGEVKTKGSLYYNVVLDKKAKSQGCTCAQAATPCSHAIALLTGWHEGDLEALTQINPPDWAEERLIKKLIKIGSKENSSLFAVGEVRIDEMMAGYRFLQTWLQDQTKEGWRRTLDPPATHLEEVAARLVNDRLPGPARLLRSLILPPSMLEDASSRFQTHLATLTLAIRLFLQGPDAQPQTWPHLLQFSGITLRKDQIRKQEPGVEDHWIRLAQEEEQEEDGLRQRKTWLYAMRHKRFALLLDFAWKRQPLPASLPNHPILKGMMTFYPGSQNLRAIPGDITRSDQSFDSVIPAYSGWSAFFNWLIAYRTVDPFTQPIPVWLDGHVLQQNTDALVWADFEGRKVLLVCTSSQHDVLRSFLGISTLSLFGLFYLHRIKPLVLFSKGQQIDL